MPAPFSIIATATHASTSLLDPLGSSPIVGAVHWLEGTLLGTLAVTIAVIAVAFVGVMTLLGRIELRHGATVIGGCFVLFGAPAIVAGIQSTVAGVAAGPPAPRAVQLTPPPRIVAPPGGAAEDPYAGTAVPRR